MDREYLPIDPPVDYERERARDEAAVMAADRGEDFDEEAWAWKYEPRPLFGNRSRSALA